MGIANLTELGGMWDLQFSSVQPNGFWLSKKLSYAGRLQLIQSVIHALVNFQSNAFVLPKKVIRAGERRCKTFLWKGKINEYIIKEAIPIFWAKPPIHLPQSSLSNPPALAMPGEPFAAPSVLSFSHPESGGIQPIFLIVLLLDE
ncbi:hypothetical protein CRG98_003100 [Punica granatum]|uniref:Uncharacterized protein n=1 Tax=Punica granatum TaxID=22663 RepID=A0A2I0L766_PUNGR|nr:hypothetical protein CRG98_003100 [Punica granatum]